VPTSCRWGGSVRNGVATFNDPDTGRLVVQDETGAIKFDNVNWRWRSTARKWRSAAKRGAPKWMSLDPAECQDAGLGGYAGSRRTSPEEWSQGKVDWEWIEVEGMAQAVTRTGSAL